MNKRDEIKKLWLECFDDSHEWVDMFFTRVYRDDDAITLSNGKNVISSMLLQRYKINFHGTEAGMSYICGAATSQNERGKGYMSRLIETALAESYSRGDTFCSLIPAESHLFDFYARKGFATVFYVRDLRFTSVHSFDCEGVFHTVDDMYAPAVYDAFSEMEHNHDGNVIHSHRDFLNILDDYRTSGNHVSAVSDGDGHVAAIGFASVDNNGIATVNELLGRDDNAKLAVLQRLKANFADLSVKVRQRAGDTTDGLTPRAMCRIVNARLALESIARSYPDLKIVVRISDPIIAQNNHTFRIDDGKVSVDDTCTGIALDVTADIFTRIICSAPAVGKLLGLPSCRPHISLMLD